VRLRPRGSLLLLLLLLLGLVGEAAAFAAAAPAAPALVGARAALNGDGEPYTPRARVKRSRTWLLEEGKEHTKKDVRTQEP